MKRPQLIQKPFSRRLPLSRDGLLNIFSFYLPLIRSLSPKVAGAKAGFGAIFMLMFVWCMVAIDASVEFLMFYV